MGILSPFEYVSIANRMSWMAKRHTTRSEDMAYSMLGIFDVNMPLLYGEGKKAFVRLQEEIMKDSDDHSLFAWQPPVDSDLRSEPFVSVFAQHPQCFEASGRIEDGRYGKRTGEPYVITNKGVRMKVRLLPYDALTRRHEPPGRLFVVIFECRFQSPGYENMALTTRPGIIVCQTSSLKEGGQFCRTGIFDMVTVTDDDVERAEEHSIYLCKILPSWLTVH